jgi:hypothetical protein
MMTKKKLSILVISLLVVAIALIMVFVVDFGKRSDQLAVLSMNEGNVLVMKPDTGTWIEVEVGMILEKGDIIKAGDNSNAVITFFEGSTIELKANTEIEVVNLAPAREDGPRTILLNQKIGETISRVTKLIDPADRYEVETPAGIAAVKGTNMIVYVIEAGLTKVVNDEGSVSVTAQGVEVHIPEVMQSIIVPGYPPSQPSLLGGEGAGFICITKSILSADVDPITYVYEVTNLGNTTQSNVYVVDDEVDVITYVGGDTNNNNMLDPDETWIYTGTEK